MAFWQLTVPSSPDTSEGLTNFLWEQGALGVVEEEGPAAPPRLRAYFPESASSTALVSSTKTYVAGLDVLGFRTARGEVEIAPLLEEAWASAWQQAFPPRAVGRRLWIKPPWEPAEALAGEIPQAAPASSTASAFPPQSTHATPQRTSARPSVSAEARCSPDRQDSRCGPCKRGERPR